MREEDEKELDRRRNLPRPNMTAPGMPAPATVLPPGETVAMLFPKRTLINHYYQLYEFKEGVQLVPVEFAEKYAAYLKDNGVTLVGPGPEPPVEVQMEIKSKPRKR